MINDLARLGREATIFIINLNELLLLDEEVTCHDVVSVLAIVIFGVLGAFGNDG